MGGVGPQLGVGQRLPLLRGLLDDLRGGQVGVPTAQQRLLDEALWGEVPQAPPDQEGPVEGLVGRPTTPLSQQTPSPPVESRSEIVQTLRHNLNEWASTKPLLGLLKLRRTEIPLLSPTEEPAPQPPLPEWERVRLEREERRRLAAEQASGDLAEIA